VRWLAGVVGVYGLSMLIAFVAVAVAWTIVRREVPWTSVAVVAVVLFAFIGADALVYGKPSQGEPFRVAVVQGGVPRPVVVGQRDAILQNHIDATRALLANKHVDVVVWPEEAVGEGVSPGAFDMVRELAREVGTPFLVGQTYVDEDRGVRGASPRGESFRNVVRHIDASGRLVETYQKRHPVPFGEYVPVGFLRRYVGTLQEQLPTDQVPGDVANVFDVDGRKIATPICFESVFPRDFLDFVRNGAELFVLTTNDSSFERTYASEQHVAHSRMRALETRQWVVEAALSGISAVITPDGTISNRTKLFTTDAFVADVRTRKAQSLYARTGDLFPGLFAAASAVAALLAFVRRRRVPPPREPAEAAILAA
jgi:apolipoprotein N-acyltransferase